MPAGARHLRASGLGGDDPVGPGRTVRRRSAGVLVPVGEFGPFDFLRDSAYTMYVDGQYESSLAAVAEMLPMAETMGATMRMSAGSVRVARATSTIPVISPVMSPELVTERMAAP